MKKYIDLDAPTGEEQAVINTRRDFRDWRHEMKRRSFVAVRKSGGGSKEAERRRKQMEKKR